MVIIAGPLKLQACGSQNKVFSPHSAFQGCRILIVWCVERELDENTMTVCSGEPEVVWNAFRMAISCWNRGRGDQGLYRLIVASERFLSL